MFEIFSDTSVEKLKIVYPTKDALNEFLRTNTEYVVRNTLNPKIKLGIEYLEKFKELYPDYEYTIHFEKKNFFKSIPVGFSVWALTVERDVVETQYMFSYLTE